MRAALALALLSGAALPGCAGDDACRGRSETCLSVTLLGEGVEEADQLQLLLQRTPRPLSPEMRLGSPQRLPFKIAVLWPDGAATVSVRSFRDGQLNGVTPEITLDLRGGAHARRMLTLFPPLPGGDRDLGRPDQRPADLRIPDLAMPDLSMPDLSTPDLSTPDLAVPDAAAEMSPTIDGAGD